MLTPQPRTEPDKTLLDRLGHCETIEIDGREWPIPKLAPRQNEVVIPIILKLWPVFLGLADKGNGEGAKGAQTAIERMRPLLEGDNLKLMYDAIFAALQRGHRSLTRDEFDNEFSISVLEAFAAFKPIATQTGLIQFAPTGGGSDPLA